MLLGNESTLLPLRLGEPEKVLELLKLPELSQLLGIEFQLRTLGRLRLGRLCARHFSIRVRLVRLLTWSLLHSPMMPAARPSA